MSRTLSTPRKFRASRRLQLESLEDRRLLTTSGSGVLDSLDEPPGLIRQEGESFVIASSSVAAIDAAFAEIEVIATVEVKENMPGAVLGTFAAHDPDAGDTHEFQTDHDLVELIGADLRLKPGVSLDAESDGTIALQIIAIDSGGLRKTETLLIHVIDVNEPPNGISLSANTVNENDTGGVVGKIKVDDPDHGDTFTFIVDDERFEIVDGYLKLLEGISLDHESESSITISVAATDRAGNSIAQSFTIVVTDINEAPTSITFTPATEQPETPVGDVSVLVFIGGVVDAVATGDGTFELILPNNDDVAAEEVIEYRTIGAPHPANGTLERRSLANRLARDIGSSQPSRVGTTYEDRSVKVDVHANINGYFMEYENGAMRMLPLPVSLRAGHQHPTLEEAIQQSRYEKPARGTPDPRNDETETAILAGLVALPIGSGDVIARTGFSIHVMQRDIYSPSGQFFVEYVGGQIEIRDVPSGTPPGQHPTKEEISPGTRSGVVLTVTKPVADTGRTIRSESRGVDIHAVGGRYFIKYADDTYEERELPAGGWLPQRDQFRVVADGSDNSHPENYFGPSLAELGLVDNRNAPTPSSELTLIGKSYLNQRGELRVAPEEQVFLQHPQSRVIVLRPAEDARVAQLPKTESSTLTTPVARLIPNGNTSTGNARKQIVLGTIVEAKLPTLSPEELDRLKSLGGVFGPISLPFLSPAPRATPQLIVPSPAQTSHSGIDNICSFGSAAVALDGGSLPLLDAGCLVFDVANAYAAGGVSDAISKTIVGVTEAALGKAIAGVSLSLCATPAAPLSCPAAVGAIGMWGYLTQTDAWNGKTDELEDLIDSLVEDLFAKFD